MTVLPWDRSASDLPWSVRGRLRAALQPLVHEDGTVVGFEGLLRVHGAAAGTPGGLFRRAEHEGWAAELDVVATELALTAAGRWSAPGQLLFVNCRPQHVADLAVALDRCLRAAQRCAWPVDRLVVELNEHQPIDDLAGLAALLGDARGAGLRFALDDVQADLGCTRLVRALRPEYVKLDGLLVRQLADPRRRRDLRRLLAVTAETESQVIAEQVERPDQVEQLQAYGVALFQGWLMGAPVVGASPTSRSWSAPAQPSAGRDTARRSTSAGTNAR